MSDNKPFSYFDGDDYHPVAWLAHPVTVDGVGYAILRSPAGGEVEISPEVRRRIVASWMACKEIPLDELEKYGFTNR